VATAVETRRGAARAPSGPGVGRRAAGALLGLLGVGVAAVVYTQIGTLGLAIAPAVALLVVSVPIFVAVPLALRLRKSGEGGRYPLALAGPSLAFYLAFFCIPLGFLLLFAFATPVGFGDVAYGFDTSNFSAALEGIYVDAFLRTLRFAGIGTLLTIVVGYPFAYWLARYAPERRKNLFLALIIVPFWTSFLIRTSSFLIVFSDSFFISRWLGDLGVTDGRLNILYTDTAVQIGIVYNYLPLFVLPVYASLERMDWRLLDAATDLGASGWRAFRQVTLRLTAPGVITGALLVFVPMMGEYVIPLVLGGGKVDLVGNIIGRSFLEQQDYAFGSALALLVMAALSIFIVAYLWLSVRAEEEFGA
jgi:spermidine/putrescine transport system permease protein